MLVGLGNWGGGRLGSSRVAVCVCTAPSYSGTRFLLGALSCVVTWPGTCGLQEEGSAAFEIVSPVPESELE